MNKLLPADCLTKLASLPGNRYKKKQGLYCCDWIS